VPPKGASFITFLTDEYVRAERDQQRRSGVIGDGADGTPEWRPEGDADERHRCLKHSEQERDTQPVLSGQPGEPEGKSYTQRVQTTPLLVLEPAGRTRSLLVRRARALSLLSIAWMTVEAGVAIVAALVAGSVALLAFGLDSLIELASASTILWLYTGSRRGSGAAECRAQQIIAICFAALALYVTFDAISTLASGSHPDTSWPGVAVAAGTILFMPLLARAKGRVASRLGSAATAGDCGAIVVMRDQRRGGASEHPFQRRAWLVVA